MCNRCNKVKLEKKDGLRIGTNVDVYVVDELGIKRYRAHNIVTDIGKNFIRDALGAFQADSKVHYCATGTGTTPTAAGDTKLQTEIFRKQITQYIQGNSGSVIFRTIYNVNDCNGENLGEFGLFAGPQATIQKDSGVLFARVLWNPAHLKTNNESVQVDWTFTVS